MVSRLALLTSAAIALGGAAYADGFTGSVSAGLGAQHFSNTDDNLSSNVGALTWSAYGRYDMGAWTAMADFNGTLQGKGASVFDDGQPGDAVSLGLHLGRTIDAAYFGVFVGLNRFQAESAVSANGHTYGQLYGIEAQGEVQTGLTVYAQAGRADMTGEPGDTAFVGRFGKVGATYDLGSMTLLGSIERGLSPNIFEDGGDWGKYRVYTIGVERPINDKLIGSIAISRSEWIANTEDEGSTNAITVGIRMPLGGDAPRNNLTTSYQPGLAAAWAAALD